MPEKAVEMRNLSLKFKRFSLKVQSLTILRGERLCIYGPNGSGKSTLAKLMTGFLQPDEGEVLVSGREVKSIPPKERAGLISYAAFDLNLLHLDKKVGDFVELGAYSRRECESLSKELNSLLETLDLHDKKEQRVSTLSAGELQRAIIAQVLVQKPAVILLDEPTAHLDIFWQVRIFDVISEFLNGTKSTQIFILHDLNLALNRFERMICMNGGSIVADFNISTLEGKTNACKRLSDIYGIEIRPFVCKNRVVGVYF